MNTSKGFGIKKLVIKVVGIILLIGLLVLAGCNTKASESGSKESITIFKSPTCGCCGVYSQYMKREGYGVTVKDMTNMDVIKDKFGVPVQVSSCHTTQVGDYFVEGHVPTEVIKKLLNETPDIAGIALPGMPVGSPGMPGRKSGTWTIYAVNHNGSIEEFMTV